MVLYGHDGPFVPMALPAASGLSPWDLLRGARPGSLGTEAVEIGNHVFACPWRVVLNGLPEMPLFHLLHMHIFLHR